MIVDAVSWRIIADDIYDLYQNKTLPQKTSSYRQWTDTIKLYPRENLKEQDFWMQQIHNGPDNFKRTVKSSLEVIELDKETTSLLLQKVPGAYHTQINDILLTALAYALKSLNQNSEQNVVFEGHGREDINKNIDHSRTVGWFTSMFPVKIVLQDDLKQSIQFIKESLRRIPNKGIGFGAFATEQDAVFSHKDLPKISFNYLGQFDANESDWQIISEESGRSVHPENKIHNIININGMVSGGELGFSIFSYLGDENTIKLSEAFKDQLHTIIEHCVNTVQVNGTLHTPSDFNTVTISQNLLSELEEKAKETKNSITHIYPANSLQQGFIYHGLTQTEDDAYRVQLIYDFKSSLDIPIYIKAWEKCIEQYPILRTAFNWEEEVIQIIYKEGNLDYQIHDLSNIESQAHRNEAIDKIQKEDRAIAFDLTKPTLFRLHIIKQKENLYTIIKSEHHSVSDGWSMPILLSNSHKYYHQLTNNIKLNIIR
jgi:non-ribosomal peptide synthase protein (TIGR01720 family)